MRASKALLIGLLVATLSVLPLRAQAPPADEQDRILAATRAYADSYVSGLPNFICLQTTRELESGLKSDKWRTRDVFVSRLSFNHGEEKRALDSINGKPFVPGKSRFRTPPSLTTEGEFGILLNQVLGPESHAYFTWSRWENVNGRRLAVFDFTVDREHSTLRLQRSDVAHATLAYSGSVYADPSDGAVWRISDTASDIPRELETREISTTIDYAQVAISGRTFLLPVSATVSTVLPFLKLRHDIAFEQYRKFAADSSVTFDSNP